MRIWKRCVTGAAILGVLAALPAGTAWARKIDTGKQRQNERLRFVLYGDTRDDPDHVHRKLVKLILEQKPALVLQTGDLVSRGSQENLWKIYDEITGEMRRKIPVYPSRGNHDVGGPGYEERVTAPFTSGNKLYYSFTRNGCHFICLAIDEQTEYGSDSPQYKWLIDDLKAVQGKARHIFVFFHVPPYSIGAHGSDLSVRRILCPVFEKYGVQAVFNGHDHIYYRTMRHGILYLVSGGGGAPLYPCFPEKGAIKGDQYGEMHHIVVCDVQGDDVRFRAMHVDGSEFDIFHLAAPARQTSQGPVPTAAR